jgi:hypothetical protein
MSFTPGPWTTDGGPREEGWSIVGGDRNAGKARRVALVPSKHIARVPDAEDKANARLIAAAPDLLGALKLCATLLVKIGDGVNPRSADAAQLYGVVVAAIAKAETNG